MLELILMLTLNPLTISSQPLAQFKPCVWPNTCKSQPAVQVVQFKPCVWPNTCKSEPVTKVAQFKPCVWPNTCKSEAKTSA